MTLQHLVEELGLAILVGGDGLDREVTGGYVGDLLSDVMAHSAPGQVWITIQGHLNVVAVATLRELAAVLLAGGRRPAEDMAAKAGQEGVVVLGSGLTAFELAGRVYQLLAG
ncbi:MAG: serine kinase [Proteobacteria bacterium]|nr:serine kinase [Pseudomonadota bacterium]MBU1740577.1 serine kinase [Pseudomonadota bacterium]